MVKWRVNSFSSGHSSGKFFTLLTTVHLEPLITQNLTCSSSIIRDLTLRSAVSFGSFHLVRLLYDEYMYYLIEHKIATMNKKTPLEVMGNDEMSTQFQPQPQPPQQQQQQQAQ